MRMIYTNSPRCASMNAADRTAGATCKRSSRRLGDARYTPARCDGDRADDRRDRGAEARSRTPSSSRTTTSARRSSRSPTSSATRSSSRGRRRRVDADVIVFCGVHFMAETAKILNPTKTVILPDLRAGCSLADSVDRRGARRRKAELRKRPSRPAGRRLRQHDRRREGRVRRLLHVSSNAVQVVEALPSRAHPLRSRQEPRRATSSRRRRRRSSPGTATATCTTRSRRSRSSR